MPAEELYISAGKEETGNPRPESGNSGFDSGTGIYHSLVQFGENHKIPTTPYLDIAKFVLSHFHHHDDSKVAFIDAATGRRLTYGQLLRSVRALACGLYHIGIRKGDVVLVLSRNSLFYPIICLAIFSIGAVLSPANPINTPLEIAKQISDAGAKLAISGPEELHKLEKPKTRYSLQCNKYITLVIVTTRQPDEDLLSVEELIECCDPNELPEITLRQEDTAAVLYSSGTSGVPKGVVLTHANFIAVIRILSWAMEASSSMDDIFLCFIPMFHVYGLGFFGLGLLCSGITSVLMSKFDMQAMIEAIQTHKVNHIPAVPPVILGLVKYGELGTKLPSLKRVGSGAAPLSQEVATAFRETFPGVELRQGYGLTETCGSSTYFVSDDQAKARPGSSGALVPEFSAKIVDVETGLPLPPGKEGGIWLKSPSIMKEYLGNVEATAETLDENGWLRTGDLGYFDEDGFLYIIDRVKELIKHNGYQVAPVELEAVLLSHPDILDAAVVPVEDEETGQIPMAYVVRAAGSELSAEQVIDFVADQVAPYKKVRRVEFISTIPKSAAGKILRKQLASDSQNHKQILSRI